MEKIKLSEILQLCIDFKLHPEKQDYELAINTLLSQFQIREYLPLVTKELALICILNCATDRLDAADSELNFVAGKVFYGILPYVVNLEIDVEYGTITPGMIDCLYELNIIDYILSSCETDYNRLEKMITEAMNFANIDKICAIPSLMSDEKLDELIHTIKTLKTDLTPEMLQTIKTISTETAPEWKALQETVAENIHDSVMKRNFDTLDEPSDKK